MYSEKDIERSLAAMGDAELIERWNTGQFSETARPIAERELRSRGLDPSAPFVALTPPANSDQEAKPYSPIMLPVLLAATGGAMVGVVGGSIFGALVALLGWYFGKQLALAFRKIPNRIVRWLLVAASLVVWFFLTGFGVVIARLMRGTLV